MCRYVHINAYNMKKFWRQTKINPNKINKKFLFLHVFIQISGGNQYHNYHQLQNIFNEI
jgi:hypothetical protein